VTNSAMLKFGRRGKRNSIIECIAAIGVALFFYTVLAVTGFANASPPKNLDGLWLTDGYRQLIEIRGDTLTINELTKLSCLQGLAAKRSTGAGADEVRFLGSEFNEDISSFVDFRLRSGADNNRLIMHVVGTIADIDLVRVAAKPAPCLRPTVADTPINNFDVFAATYAENYPFFRLKHVDWDRVTASNRRRVTAETTPAQLLDILKSMFLPLQDAHTGIYAVSLDEVAGGFRPPEPIPEEQASKALSIIDSNYVRGGLTDFCNGQLRFGMLDNGVAYLRILSYSNYLDDADFETQLKTLETALDAIFVNATQWSGLVIDVRLNGGGSDAFGISIASRLASSPYLAYYKVIRNDPWVESSRSRPQPIIVRPVARPSFNGKVTLLIGNQSVSAAETQAQALLDRVPRVTMIGENTQGVFSDVLQRKLPNGWRFGLPNEIYLTRRGAAFDGVGIEPDIRRPVFAKRDLDEGKDPALETGIHLISRYRH
jgi:Peptidase family S41